MEDQLGESILDQQGAFLVGEVASGSAEVVTINGVRWLAPVRRKPIRQRVPKPRKALVPAPKRWQDIYDEGM